MLFQLIPGIFTPRVCYIGDRYEVSGNWTTFSCFKSLITLGYFHVFCVICGQWNWGCSYKYLIQFKSNILIHSTAKIDMPQWKPIGNVNRLNYDASTDSIKSDPSLRAISYIANLISMLISSLKKTIKFYQSMPIFASPVTFYLKVLFGHLLVRSNSQLEGGGGIFHLVSEPML